MSEVTCLEIFAGAGGLAQGIGRNKVQHKALVEWNKDACKTLRTNYKEEVVYNLDIRDFDFKNFGAVGLVAGGPPCQPFSLGGKHTGNTDQRDMFPYACKAITECTPKAFIFENVKGLLRKSFSSYFSYILLRLTYPEVEMRENFSWVDHLKTLENIHTSGVYSGVKYNVVFRLVDAADYGVPQRRERVILVGIRDDLNVEWSFPSKTHSLESLVWSQFVDNSYWDNHKAITPNLNCYDQRTRSLIHRLKNQSTLFPPELKPWRTIRDQLSQIPEPDKSGSFHQEHVLREGARTYEGHTGSFVDLPSKALKAGDHGVPGGENMLRLEDGSVRYFTTFEAKRIQTFPTDYKIRGSWTGSMRQIGNAVPVELAQVISKSLVDAVWGTSK